MTSNIFFKKYFKILYELIIFKENSIKITKFKFKKNRLQIA